MRILTKACASARTASVRWHTGSRDQGPHRASDISVRQRTDAPSGKPLRLPTLQPSINRLQREELKMNSIVYIVGAIVIIVAILSFFGLR